MKTVKNLRTLLIFLSLIVLLFVSCKNEDKTGSEENGSNGSENSEITLSHYAGEWLDSSTGKVLLTIKDDGSFADENNLPFNSSDIIKNNEKSYTLSDGAELNFTSDTEGTFKTKDGESANITKK